MSMLFDQEGILELLQGLTDLELDSLDFGVIGFDSGGAVCRYNAYESSHSRVSPDQARGSQLFTELAQCMNNYMVAQQFEAAGAAGKSLDVLMDYVFSWRMRPTQVRLRLLYEESSPTRYILVRYEG